VQFAGLDVLKQHDRRIDEEIDALAEQLGER
jgi:hypothetical protein